MPSQITLTTTGRRSGKARAVILYAYEDGDRLVIVGSNGGRSRHPGWVHNLRSHPRALVKRGRKALEMTTREVAGSEHDRLWGLVTGAFPLYATYQRRTRRQIPLFVLEAVEPRLS
jgi:deazaflavin-dependent oxidoreductase (nitroreductase family)